MADGGECWGDAGALSAGYERLRSAVLSGSASGWRLGHGVLCARGMTGWMSAFGSLAPPAPGGQAPERGGAGGGACGIHPDAPTGGVASLPGANQLVAVLAQMTLFHAA
ncbi:MAG: hypothetical protein ACLP0J_17045 [Solirubrobacteraceae bacterium]